MKNRLLAFFFLSISCFGYSQNDTILIDFGNISSPLPWNNISNPWTGSTENLLNSDGISTPIAITVIDSFNYINTSGTTSPNPSLGIAPTASEDSFFGNDVVFSDDLQPTAAVELTGLDIDKVYTLSIFASRITSENRETQYIVKGETKDTLYLDVGSNTNQIVSSALYPNEDGVIQIEMAAGPNNENSFGFFYLGAMQLIYEEEEVIIPASIDLQIPDGGEFWQSGKTVEILWESVNVGLVILEYSLDGGQFWAAIDTVFASTGQYEWLVPDMPSEQCLVRLSADLMHDQSTGLFTIAQDSTTCPIVVLGSSTAAGVGPSSSDSTWVNRYRRALYSRDTRYPIINLGKGGYTTYHILPDDAEIPDNINISIDSSRNLSEALSYDPYAIIINMPSNDAANSFGIDQQLANFDLMRDAANAEGVETYICTTQPRNFNNSNQIMIQEDMRDTILSHYGTFAIDFWSGIADSMGGIQPIYDSGDGVHLNDAGHAILFERVMQKQLDTTICNDIISTIGSVEKLGPIDSRLYPNPFSDQLNLQLLLSQNAKVSVKLIDLLGRDYGEYTWDLLDGNHQLSFELPKAYFSNPQFLIAVIYIKMEDEVYIQQQKILRLP